MTDWEEKYKQERAARQEAQLQLVEYKELLARARLDVMRQLKEQDWTPEWHAPAERLVEWLHCMSYNDSYFGEPAGYLKQCVNELRHLLPPHELKAAAPSAAPQSAERVSLTAVAFEALETDLIAECERAMRQRDEFLRTGVRTGGDGMAWDTCFGFILRKHGITPNEKQV